MTFSRIVQAAIPLLLSPLVMFLLGSSGNDKAMAFSIPWLAFSGFYLVAFLFLSRFFKSTFVLTVVSGIFSLVAGGFGISYAVVAYLTAHAGA